MWTRTSFLFKKSIISFWTAWLFEYLSNFYLQIWCNHLTSCNNSDAANRCFKIGWASGDSSIGSIGSIGDIKWAKMHNLGSDTSRTLRWPCLVSESIGGGTYNKILKKINAYWFITLHKLKISTGTPAGRKRSIERIGMIKQSFSKVVKEMGSLLELTNPFIASLASPPRLTVIIVKLWYVSVR